MWFQGSFVVVVFVSFVCLGGFGSLRCRRRSGIQGGGHCMPVRQADLAGLAVGAQKAWPSRASPLGWWQGRTAH